MIRRRKSAGFADSGWKCLFTKYVIAPTTNMMSRNGDTSGNRIWKMITLGKATQPKAPLCFSASLCFHTACMMPNDQRKRWRINPFAVVVGACGFDVGGAPGADCSGNYTDRVERVKGTALEILAGDVFQRLPARPEVHAVADFCIARHGCHARIAEVWY